MKNLMKTGYQIAAGTYPHDPFDVPPQQVNPPAQNPYVPHSKGNTGVAVAIVALLAIGGGYLWYRYKNRKK